MELIIIGFVFVVASLGTPATSTWLALCGLMLLVGALTVFLKNKGWMKVALLGFSLMAFLFLLGFYASVWNAHPLGAIIGLVGIGWVIYKIGVEQGRQYWTMLNHSPWIKWVLVFVFELILLWILKSIWLTFAICFVLLLILYRESLKEKGINLVGILLIIYLVGFLFLLIVAFKIDDARIGGYYHEVFLKRESYMLLHDLMRGL